MGSASVGIEGQNKDRCDGPDSSSYLTSTTAFPNLTDGYIPDRRKCGVGKKCHKIDLAAFNEAPTRHNAIDLHEVPPEAVILAAWALTIARYIGTDDVSFYVFLGGASMRFASICHLAVYESKTQLQLLHESRDYLYGPAGSRRAPLEEIASHELSERCSSQFSNIAIVFEKESSNGVANMIDQVRKDVCDLTSRSLSFFGNNHRLSGKFSSLTRRRD